MEFKLHSEYQPTGDQPQAIETLVKGFQEGNQFQTLLGVTGSGKTFTMANVIANPEAYPHHCPQQNPCRTALQRVQGIFPGECGGVFCELLRKTKQTTTD